MHPRPGSSGPITARLDALRHELRTEIAGIRAEMHQEFGALKGELGELKGMLRGFTVALSVGVPVVSGLLILGINLMSRKLGL